MTNLRFFYFCILLEGKGILVEVGILAEEGHFAEARILAEGDPLAVVGMVDKQSGHVVVGNTLATCI